MAPALCQAPCYAKSGRFQQPLGTGESCRRSSSAEISLGAGHWHRLHFTHTDVKGFIPHPAPPEPQDMFLKDPVPCPRGSARARVTKTPRNTHPWQRLSVSCCATSHALRSGQPPLQPPLEPWCPPGQHTGPCCLDGS